jgi:hypothetical protein
LTNIGASNGLLRQYLLNRYGFPAASL